jgi:hypothetical protein
MRSVPFLGSISVVLSRVHPLVGGMYFARIHLKHIKVTLQGITQFEVYSTYLEACSTLETFGEQHLVLGIF